MILVLNAGSSSLKFAVYRSSDVPELVMAGQVERLGPDARLILKGEAPRQLGATDHARAIQEIVAVLPEGQVRGVGHRIVHGGTDFEGPTLIDETALSKLRLLIPLAPLHQPHNIRCIDAAMALFPDAVQVGCFDTSFHRNHPWVNDTFGLPREYYRLGIRRYGFHGLSYDYITGVIARDYPELAKGRIAICHLGNGASICGVENGQSQASTMGFSALDGLPMGTRSGQIDPGVLLYLLEQQGMTPAELSKLLYHDSGMLGLSGISADMRTLEASEAKEAAQAIDYYVFRIKREIGGMAAVMGGLDGLVFTGGVGENSARVRAEVTADLGFIGIGLNAERNAVNATDIGDGTARVLVIPTDEEGVIARAVSDRMDGRV